jgi:hypothetical protein
MNLLRIDSPHPQTIPFDKNFLFMEGCKGKTPFVCQIFLK